MCDKSALVFVLSFDADRGLAAKSVTGKVGLQRVFVDNPKSGRHRLPPVPSDEVKWTISVEKRNDSVGVQCEGLR